MNTPENQEASKIEALYRPVVEQIVERWAVGKPPNPSPAATSDKPGGYFRLTGYLLDYVMKNHSLPTGAHRMPEGRDRFGNFEPGFVVNFDQIVADMSLPEL